MNTKTLGQVAFEAYSAAVGGKTYDGKPIPQWHEVRAEIQQGWEAAAKVAAYTIREKSTAPGEVITAEEQVWHALFATYQKLKSAKPEDRSEKARRYAVTITEYEKMLSYFNTMVWESLGE